MDQNTGSGKKFVILVSIILLIPMFILLFNGMNHVFKELPHYYPIDVVQKEVNGELRTDTIWHQIPEFDLIDHNGDPIGREHLKGKITLVDFFFTTCPTICPKMTANMSQLVWLLEEEYFAEDVQFLSISVNPEHDTPEVLRRYARKVEADTSRWTFATGSEDVIFPLGVKGFKLATQEDVNAAGGFLHSEKFVLVDRDLHIRGYYDGTKLDGRIQAEEDIKHLIGTERKRKKLERKGK